MKTRIVITAKESLLWNLVMVARPKLALRHGAAEVFDMKAERDRAVA